MSAPKSDGKRPVLVVLTQALLICAVGFVLYTLGDAGFMLARGQATGPSAIRFVSGCLFVLVTTSPLAVLFYGLVRRRRWSWPGSVAFAALLAGGMLFSVLSHPLELDPNTAWEEKTGQVIGAFSLPVLLSIYAVRLYFSSKVRAFLGIRQRVQHGR